MGGSITNDNRTYVVVHTRSDKPKEVGGETAEAISKAREKRNALASVVKP